MTVERAPAPWVLSGTGAAALREYAQRLAEATRDADAADVAWTLATGPPASAHRAVILGDDRGAALRDLAGGTPSPQVIQGVADPDLHPDRPVFVFSGQGGQWAGMAVELLDASPVFAEHMRACAKALAPHVDWVLEDVLRGSPDAPALERIDVVPPALVAVMVSLAALWRSRGVEPAAVVGHSHGEIAAAHVAGVLSLDDALRVAAVRARALTSLSGHGGMAAVSLRPDALEQRIAGFGERLALAAVNGPSDLVVSGDLDAIDELLAGCEADGVRARRVAVDYAAHGPQIEAIRERLLDELGEVTPQPAQVPLYPTTADEPMDATYWYRGERQTVQFAPAVQRLLADGHRTFIEVGPHPVLTVPVEHVAEEALGGAGQVATVATLRRGQGGPERFATALAELWTRGGSVDWAREIPEGTRVDLPAPAETGPADDETFAARIRAMGDAEARRAVLDGVSGLAAVQLGQGSASDIDAGLTFKELGLDSPGLVELRNRVNDWTGLRLPATVVFDNPTPAALADRVLAELTGDGADAEWSPRTVRMEEPIAIVGMACRYPGGVASPDELWELVASGGNPIGDFPTDRGWDLERLIDRDGERLDASYVDQGYFLYDAGDFDPEVFGISPREALSMDPQQRLMLECSWEALENAGIDPLSLRGSSTGVFTGMMSALYGPLMHQPDEKSVGYALTGTETSVASGRVAYVLGLEGPAVSVDTACSASLVALHLACQSLRAGECDLALAGGATVMSQPGIFIEISRQRGLAPDARCKAFGAGANGTGWSEGAGVIALEPLSAAIERGHEVLAVIRGSAVNQDGASNGLSAPNGRSQERVIRTALASAGLEPADVDAVEAHGTGTALGDPIEATALLNTYGQHRDEPLRLGSLKSNLGHSQAAAGVGGVIKMVQALRHARLPKTLWADEPTPHVDWDSGAVELLTEPIDWPVDDRPRRAGVSSFGISGTNAHVILEQAPEPEPERAAKVPSRVLPFLVSASSEAGLAGQAQRLAQFVAARPELEPAEVAASLALRRAQLPHRAVAVAGDLTELSEHLSAFARGEFVEAVTQGVARGERRAAFVFPGQGGQWEGMAVELLDSSSVFAERMRACEAALAPYVDWSLEAVLRGEDGAPSIDLIEVVQPVLFAIMVSLAEVWRTFGIEPAAVVGHSQGEIAAAHIIGALSLEDAARIVAVRSQALATIAGVGGMLAVALSREQFEQRTADLDGRITIAAVNGPRSMVVSGEPEILEQFAASLEADGVQVRRILSTVPGHSPYVEAVREQMLEGLEGIQPQPSTIPLFSTVTAERIATETMDAEHWYRNLRQTVQFQPAVQQLIGEGIDALIEIGPHPVLTTHVQDTIETAGHDPDAITLISSLRRDDGGLERMIASFADAQVAGLAIDWTALFGATPPHVPLPTYAFQRERYWNAPPIGAGSDPAAIGQASAEHPLLDAAIALPDGGALYTGRLSLERHPWLADHAAVGTALLPGAAFLDLALHAAAHTDTPRIEELTLRAPLLLDGDRAVAVQVTVTAPDADGARALTVHSQSGDGPWTHHVSAALGAADPRSVAIPEPPADAESLSDDGMYDRFADAGYEYGPAFQALRSVRRAGDEVYAEAALAEDQEQQAAGFALHPSLFDAVLQAAVLRDLAAGGDGMPIPFSFTGVQLHAPHATAARALLTARDGETEILVVDGDGAPVLSVDAFQMRPLDRRALRAGGPAGPDELYEVRWEEIAPSGGGAPHVVGIGLDDALTQEHYESFGALEAAVAGGAAAPDVVLVPAGEIDAGPIEAVHALTQRTLELLQAWLASEPLTDARLVVVTRGATGARPDLAQSALLGLLRSAHTEHPDRFTLLDLDGSVPPRDALLDALTADEPVLAVRRGAVLAPRLARADADPTTVPRVDDPTWHLALGADGVEFAPRPDAGRALEPGEVRIAVRAAGLNFKDVVVSMGLVEDTTIGLEGAGVVLETGEDVTDLAPGDRVMGLIRDAYGPEAIADRRLVAAIPDDWTFEQAASVPVVFLTAWYSLVDLAGLRAGESVLLHGAAGGVGMAARQIAAHLGAEVFATAHPSKWDTVAALGIEPSHIANSRTTEFREAFLETTEGRGVDVVLGSLAGEIVDASLDLLPRGGRFIEMGKTDIRDPEKVASERPGVRYQPVDLITDPGPERTGEMLAEIVALFEQGALHHLPIATRDVRGAASAFAYLQEARHTGKVVLRVPRALDPDGMVLITGGTGGLGAMLARHLAGQGARRLLLVSRRGPAAEGADELVAALAALGAEATVAACDVSDRAQLAQLLEQVPALTAVVHTAGVLDDGVISSLDAEQLHRVLAPKVDAAIHLDELTRDHDLAEFILYSSVAATLGLPGQANYAAANAVLDGLAQRRRAEGLPGSAMAFGVWETATGMSGHLAGDDGVLQGPAGLVPIPDDDGLELIDEARALGRPLLLPTLFDRPGLRAQARAGVLAPILRGLFSTPSRSASAGGTAFAAKLAAAPERDREALALDLVREHLAAVLGHSSTAQIDAQRTFKEAGIDSLSAVELRNRISRAAGQRLPATLVFDYPTPAAVATLLSGMVEGSAPKAAPARRATPTTTDEPIAIVGMACRYPGGIASPDDLWDVVVSGRDAIGEFPDDRGWGVERLFDPDPDHIGTTYVRRGGFLRDAAGFDADHFGISPREALATDPQQRVFLECAWEALENAGIDPLSLRGSSTGVFAGVFDSDYGAGSDAPDLEGFRLLGGLASATPGRISYQLGLEGPAVSVDTACSSSLVAMHLAAQALRAGECDLALTGGVTVLATAESFVEMSRQRGLSPDGRCRAFGAGANGTGFSDGAGILVMERLSVARERGHQVLAVVRSSAINQDGASNGFAAPSGPSQERVIRAALANGGLQPSDVDAVEAHGTGTTLGDPMEAGALLATYGQDRAAGPLKLGSLKSNIGHSQAAAGVGGVIKMVQALRHELLPRTLYAEEPSPHISWDEGAVELLTEPVPWQAGERPRRAGVSSFGMSGTNAHVVIEEAPPEETEPVAPEIPSRVLPYAISASSDVALAAQAERLAEFLAGRDDLDAAAVAATLALHRAQLPHRAVAVAGGLGELADRLSAFARGEFVETIAQGVARGERRAAFVFPGQGGQWEGMAVELLDSSPVFAERMRACQAALAPHVDWDLEAVLRREDGAPSIDLIEVVQPVLFAIMVSLAALWRSYGIEPSAVVGHSQGEIAAAHIIGALTLEDAARVVAVRSQALATIAGVGGMLAVALSVEQLQERAADLGDRVTIAAVNGPRSLVISGDPELLDTFAAGCEADGVRVRRILSTVPGHSPPVEAVRELMLEGLAGVAPMPSSIPLYSTVTGERIATETMDAEHWYRNLRQTVLFQPAASALIGDGIDALIEIGPHPVLAAPLQEILESTPDIASITTLRRDDGGLERFIASLADAHVAGLRVDWTALFGSAPPRAPLPTYAFQHRRYWLEAGSGEQDAEALGVLPAEHPLLRATTPLPGGGALWTGRLSLAEHAWLADHAVLGDVVVPATLFLDAVLHAAIETDTPVIDELTVTAPLVLEQGKPVALQVTVLPADAEGRHQVTVSSRPERPDDGDAELIEHAVGTLIADPGPVTAPTPWPADGDDLDPASAYARLSEAGYELGPVFHGLSNAVRDGDALHAEAGLGDETDEAHRYDLHPALLMSGLQAMALAGDPRAPEMPFAFSGVRLHQRGAASLRLELAPGENGWGVVASDGDGAAVLSIDAVRTQPVDAGRPARRSLRNALYAIEWSAAPQTDVNGSGPRVAVLGDGPELPGERYDDLAALVAAVEAGAEAPAQVLLAIPPADGELPEAAHALTARVLAILQAWLEADALGAARLAVLTRGAVAGAGGRPDLRQAPLAGLVRTAGSEHPGRFVLIDADDDAPSATVLLSALATDEPEVAIRDGALLVPRVRPFRAEEAEAPAPEHPTGTVLITGGVTGLGAMLAHHLAERQGARHLLLVSRRGAETPGAAELVAELRAAGCDAEVAACDVADRAALERLLATIPPERPLTAVFHSAAALDDGVLTAMDGERLRRVMRPKMDAALHLHELTRDLELSEFVLFSSAACCLGNPGQANYAAANAFLDALAAIRRADGLPGLALAFGFWGRVTDLTQHLTADDGRRVGPLDLLPMSDELGLDLIDAARGTHEPLLAPMRFDLSKLAGRAQSGILPPILSSLVRARPRRAAARTLAPAGGNGANGAGVGADAIRGEIAAALGYESADAVDMQLTFLELGFDSLVTLELRKRLQALTGLALPTTVLFDHPTPAALVAHLVGELGGTVAPEPAAGTANGNGAHGGGVLDGLFRRACRLHRTRDAIAIAEAHARLRPRFGVSHHRRQAPTAVPLAQGPAEPIVACIPSLIASSGPHEYARFAKAFAGRREVIAVPVPGFLPNELLPSRIDAAAGAQAITIAEHAQGRPVALVGFSTGGLLAHAVAAELARIGAPAASVALIDSYTVDTMLPIADLVFDRMLEGNGAHPAVDDDRLGAMGVYLGLLAAWTPPPRAAPTLLVKATEPVPGLVRVGDWTASWPQRDAVANLPGTHLTILEDHAETTARAVEDWVARHPAAVAPSARHRFRLRVR